MGSPHTLQIPCPSFSLISQPFNSSHTNHNYSSKPIKNRKNSCNCHKRRALLLSSILPLLLPLHHLPQSFDACAVEDNDSSLIRDELRKVMSKAKAAGLLRLVFHDAGTFDLDDDSGGINGSLVFELDRPENAGLRKPLKVLAKAKTNIDKIVPVSWADMIALAGAEAVSLCGGPKIPVELGRLDALVPDPEGRLPEESSDASSLKTCFQRKGLSTQDLVALSGAHTLGGKGFGNPTVFDNSYFKILLEKPWNSSADMSSMIGLPSDHALAEDDECLRWITLYAENEKRFFSDFVTAYTKLVNSGARWQKS
ncbi:putative L-ascorbate peroxidase 6 isoform X1 [Amborella trichopoda]|uniref:putative L-ascorbate peroxidase 6 isoform X1 n=1 Tax=Amborella trichopoda TaxID=13333 RepID=UPI0005D3D9E5|nr:putative L-ascorbate peroxidase 6 isoform X1 [Amborella trichopoda]|eukprot:XP_011622459.1 putative L-ascorbate peroxidase 6 isoform X1 [Amborella trichopoda]